MFQKNSFGGKGMNRKILLFVIGLLVLGIVIASTVWYNHDVTYLGNIYGGSSWYFKTWNVTENLTAYCIVGSNGIDCYWESNS